MSDTSYPVFQHYGTHAERLAFTPTPGALGQPIYIWYETDTGSAFLYDTSWHTLSTSSPGTVTHTAGALTASAVMVGNGTDDAKVLASLGTTTTVLHGNAAGLPTFGAVALASDVSGILPGAQGGGLVLLGTFTASGGATLDMVTRNATGASGAIFQSDYDTYLVTISSLTSNTNTADIGLLVSTDGGGTYATTNYFMSAIITRLGTGVTAVNASTTEIQLNNSYGTGVTRHRIGGSILVTDPLSSLNKQFQLDFNFPSSDGNWYSAKGGAVYNSASGVNALQVKPSSGTVTGAIYIHGTAK